jgi:hypothetical protein
VTKRNLDKKKNQQEDNVDLKPDVLFVDAGSSTGSELNDYFNSNHALVAY